MPGNDGDGRASSASPASVRDARLGGVGDDEAQLRVAPRRRGTRRSPGTGDAAADRDTTSRDSTMRPSARPRRITVYRPSCSLTCRAMPAAIGCTSTTRPPNSRARSAARTSSRRTRAGSSRRRTAAPSRAAPSAARGSVGSAGRPVAARRRASFGVEPGRAALTASRRPSRSRSRGSRCVRSSSARGRWRRRAPARTALGAQRVERRWCRARSARRRSRSSAASSRARSELVLILIVGDGKPSGVPRPGREQQHVRARRRPSPSTNAVVARRVDQRRCRPARRAPARRSASTCATGASPALLHAAERLLRQRRDAARLVARRRVLVDGLVVAAEVGAEAVDHVDGVRGDVVAGRAVEQHLLGAEHLGHLGQQHGAARAREAVGDLADQRVGGDARKPSLPPHFIPRISSGAGIGSRFALAGVVRPACATRARPSSTSSPTSWALKYSTRVGLDRADLLEQQLHLVVLAAEPQDQHAARVGVADQAGQHPLRVARDRRRAASSRTGAGRRARRRRVVPAHRARRARRRRCARRRC